MSEEKEIGKFTSCRDILLVFGTCSCAILLPVLTFGVVACTCLLFSDNVFRNGCKWVATDLLLGVTLPLTRIPSRREEIFVTNSSAQLLQNSCTPCESYIRIFNI